MVYRAYQTKYSDLIVLRLQSGGDLLLAGSRSSACGSCVNLTALSDEVGTLLLYDISLDSESPRQILALSFEYSGISEICWLDGDTVAVGTTRGRIVIFTVKNELVSWIYTLPGSSNSTFDGCSTEANDRKIEC